MNHTEQEMSFLRQEVNLMWQLVHTQLEMARKALLQHDVATARTVLANERRVDIYELKVDADCEKYIALYNPVAIDLRLALSLLKVGQTLERIGDFAAGIALHVVEDGCTPHDPQLIERLHIERMFDIVLDMLHKAYQALDTEDTKLAHQVLTSDEEMNRLYHQAQRSLAEHLEQQPKGAFCALKLLLMIRKLERIGDHCSNISEEIVFYIDARVLKHQARTSSTADTKTT